MKFLIIQTAFIGDVILATSLVEMVKHYFPQAQIDFLLRKGNEGLLSNHPHIKKIHIWDKKNGKYLNLIKMALDARKEKYDYALNIQRYASSGVFLALCGAKVKIGFKQNPLSFFFNRKVHHKIPYEYHGQYLHEVQRNALLLEPIVENFILPEAAKIPPSLAVSSSDHLKVDEIAQGRYIVMAPSSVWFTKQWGKNKWIDLKNRLQDRYQLFFIGGPEDKDFVDSIILKSKNCVNLCGKLNLLQSAALMEKAQRVFVNDSAPLHLASAVNAKITAIFCSTIPEFGYTPLANDSRIIQVQPRLTCRPCGLHGKKTCPQQHFNCSELINIDDVVDGLS